MIFFNLKIGRILRRDFFEHLNDSSRVKENVGGRVFLVFVMIDNV